MRDYLVKVASIAGAKAALPQWVDAETGAWKPPTWCGLLQVDAYTDMGTPAVLDNTTSPPTIITPATAPTLAGGKWFIVSIDRDVTVPAAAQGAIQAQGDRVDGLTLPASIKGLSIAWSGMTLL